MNQPIRLLRRSLLATTSAIATLLALAGSVFASSGGASFP